MLSPLDAGQPLLVAAPASWRTACFSLPASRSLMADGRPVSILCPQTQRPLWEAAGFGEVIDYPDGASARKIAAVLPEVDAVVLWEAGAAASACQRLPQRLGPRGDAKLEKSLTHPLGARPRPGPVEHDARFFLEWVRELDADPYQGEYFRPLREVPQEGGQLLVIPDSDFGSNYHWPGERWSELAGVLQGKGLGIVVGRIGGMPSQAAEALAEALDQQALDIELPGLETMARFRHCLSIENSAVHLAAAAGCTCAVLFGPGDLDRHRPLGTRHRPIRRKVECSPCLLAKCPLDQRCQLELSVTEVLRKLGPLLGEGG